MILRSLSVVLVDDVNKVRRFFESIIEISEVIEAKDMPFRGIIICVEKGANILVVEEFSCDTSTIKVLKGFNCSKYLCFCVDKPAEVQVQAVEVGASLIELGNTDRKISDDSVLVGGPCGIVVHLSPNDSKSTSASAILDRVLPDLFKHVGVENKKAIPRSVARRMSKAQGLNEYSNDMNEEYEDDELLVEEEEEEEEQLAKGANTPKKPKPKSVNPAIPSVQALIMNNRARNGNYSACEPNFKHAISFDTDIFKGTCLLLIRTDPLDTKYAPFFEGKRQFEVQVQGKFKRVPKGQIYVGAETGHKMELGILTRSIVKALLKFAGSMVNNLHYSFGDDPTKPDWQASHVVAPIVCGMDRIVITPQGEKAPEMGEPFAPYESWEARKKRVSSKEKLRIDTTSTYSMSVNTSNIDLTSWSMVGVPMVGKVAMSNLFGDTFIKLVAYELPPEVAEANPNKHPIDKLKYVFNMKIVPIDPNSDPASFAIMDDAEEDQDDIEDEPAMEIAMDADTEASDAADDAISREQKSKAESVSPEEDEVTPSEQDQNGSNGTRGGQNNQSTQKPGSRLMQRWDVMRGRRKSDTNGNGKDDGKDGERDGFVDRIGNFVKRHNPLSSADGNDVQETNQPCSPDYKLEGWEDLDYCPASVEVADPRKEGRRRIVYLIMHRPSEAKINNNKVDGDNNKIILEPRLRSYAEVSNILHLVPLSRQPKNKRIAVKEKKRRQIVETYVGLMNQDQDANQKIDSKNRLNKLLAANNETDVGFLGGNASVTKYTDNSGRTSVEGLVAHATSRRSWSEEYLVLTEQSLALHLRQDVRRDIRRATVSIPIATILSVRPMADSEVPTACYKYFQVETFARVFYFMVKGQRQLDEWFDAFGIILGSQKVTKVTSGQHSSDAITASYVTPIEPEDAYLARPSCWKVEKRRILNYRRIIFRALDVENESSSGNLTLRRFARVGPCAVIESLLDSALVLSAQGGVADVSLWIDFMDTLSYLQILTLDKLEIPEKVALLLNLYHVMVLHGNLVFGPPLAWQSWTFFFNSVSYVVGFDIISAEELEYNVLRAAMSRPSRYNISNLVPTTEYPDFSLPFGDFRFNFCINSGSRSMPAVVPIYRADFLDEQLDRATKLMLASSVVVEKQRRSVTLPKICSWFLADFSSQNRSSIQSADCLRVIVHYLQGDHKRMLLTMLTDGGHIAVRFGKFIYRCSSFSKADFREKKLAISKEDTKRLERERKRGVVL